MTGARGPEPGKIDGRIRSADSIRSGWPAIAALLAVIIGVTIFRTATAPGAVSPSQEATSSVEPSASAEASGPAGPTDSAITPIVVPAGERPAVPDSLRDRYWIGGVPAAAYWPTATDASSLIAGVVGSTAVIILPPGERGIGADDSRVATYVRGDNVSTIFVRRFEDGALLRVIETPMVVRDALLVGPHLFWSGALLDGTALLDGGTSGIDLGTPDAQPVQIIEPQKDVSRFGDTFDYEEWVVSDTRHTAVTWFGNGSTVQGYVIDVDSFDLRGAFLDAVPRGVTDEALLLSVSGTLTLQDLKTGERPWTIDTPQDTNGILTTPILRNGELIVGFEDGSTYVIAAINVQTGAIRDLAVQSTGGTDPILYFMPRLSSADALVLLPARTLSEAFGDTGEASASLLDPETGNVIRDVFSIGHHR